MNQVSHVKNMYIMTSLEGCTKRSGCNLGHSPGLQRVRQLSGRQYLDMPLWIARYCLPGSCFASTYRGLRPRLRPLRLVQPSRLVIAFFASSRKLPPYGQWVQGQISLSTAIASLRSATVGSRLVVTYYIFHLSIS